MSPCVRAVCAAGAKNQTLVSGRTVAAASASQLGVFRPSISTPCKTLPGPSCRSRPFLAQGRPAGTTFTDITRREFALRQ
eukprot:scaffold672670_cov114-Prasinocladus_malaysianus.AAC.1